VHLLQDFAAHGLHWILHVLILVQPISGYVHRMAGHIAVALKHRLIDRDAVMQRVIP
jgi:cytochrome b561